MEVCILLEYNVPTMTNMKRVVIYIPNELYNRIVKASHGKPISQTIRKVLELVLGWQ